MAKMEKNMSQLRSIYQAELERKDALCEVEKKMVSKELQETYKVMILERYA